MAAIGNLHFTREKGKGKKKEGIEKTGKEEDKEGEKELIKGRSKGK